MRKWILMAMTILGLTALVAATPIQEDEDEKLTFDELMTKVSKTNTGIRKIYRSPIVYKKDSGKIVESAELLVKLGKIARKETKYAEKLEKPVEEWQKLMDEMIASCETLAEGVKDGQSYRDIRTLHRNVTRTCSKCHSVFRVDDDFVADRN